MTKNENISDLIRQLQEPKTTISRCKKLMYVDADLAMRAAQTIIELQQKLKNNIVTMISFEIL